MKIVHSNSNRPEWLHPPHAKYERVGFDDTPADPQALRKGVFWAITITLIGAAFFGGAVLRFGLGS